MTTQGTGGRSDGSFARKTLGRVVNALLDYFQHSESYDAVADTNAENLFGGAELHGFVFVFDKTNDTVALFEVQGSTGGAAVLASGAGSYGTASGTDAQTNLYYNTDHYEIENQTGGDVDYEVFTLRTP